MHNLHRQREFSPGRHSREGDLREYVVFHILGGRRLIFRLPDDRMLS